MASQAQADWVQRVLGVTVTGVTVTPANAAAPDGARIPAGELLALFRDAKDEVDTGLSALAAALRDTEDEDLVRIADYGMYGMTNGEGVGLMKALLNLRGATPDKLEAMSNAARNAATAYKAAVFRHVLVDLVDKNPFGVTVGIKARLGPVLDTIARAA